jgi:hypothetical protein
MKKLYILLIALVLVNGALAQGCLPQGIMFTTQAQIDSFQINYPNCTQIEGMVIIGIEGAFGLGTNINNLDGLSVLTSIGGSLIIRYNDPLTSLNGLANLTIIGGELDIHHNHGLTNLVGLANLISIGGLLEISGDNSALTSLAGLEGLTSIPGDLTIYANPILTNLAGLHNVKSIEGILDIEFNDSLTSLTGLDSIEAGSISDLTITDNLSLSTCEVKSICDYLASPNGTASIIGNAPGCNTQQEVENSCAAVGVESLNPGSSFIIYPNPALDEISVSGLPVNSEIRIIDLKGKQMMTETMLNTIATFDIHNLPQGVYILRSTLGIRKIVKM